MFRQKVRDVGLLIATFRSASNGRKDTSCKFQLFHGWEETCNTSEEIAFILEEQEAELFPA